jgi:hypothetical protein
VFVSRQWEQAERDAALALAAQGLTDGAVERRTGIPRRTVNGWRRSPQRRLLPARDQSGWRPDDDGLYAYALGVYLGDGHIAQVRGCYFLRVSMDGAYPGLVAEVRAALGALFAPRAASALDYAPGRGVVVQLSHPALPFAFPQHGPGKKHLRRIELVPWQRELTHRHPELFLRGLIHSDGCRVLNRFTTTLPSGREGRYSYPRYFFTNLSADIRRLFCEHCELLGIRWTQSNARNISVSHRDSVRRFDEFVGPKA